MKCCKSKKNYDENDKIHKKREKLFGGIKWVSFGWYERDDWGVSDIGYWGLYPTCFRFWFDARDLLSHV